MTEISKDTSFQILHTTRPVGSRVLFGSQEEPLVKEQAWADGKREIIRIVHPERSTQIPTIVFWDHTITEVQQTLIKEAFSELFNAAGLDESQISYHGNWHDETFTDEKGILIANQSVEWQIQSKWNATKKQANGDRIVSAMRSDPHQTQIPHWEALFTNVDLYAEQMNFIIGCADADLGAIISLNRLEKIADPTLRKEAEKTEIFHEFGHVLNLPSNRRGVQNLEQSLGGHCKNHGCSMKQGLTVPDDWINFTVDRMKLNKGPFCGDCQMDLDQKFHR